jgi:UDP-N-acetylglucosamine acyltransferase
VRIGQHSMVGGMTGVENDVIPYGLVIGDRARLSGLNLRGLQRRGFGKEAIQALRAAYRMLFANEGTLAERLEDVARHFVGVGPVVEIIDFIRADSSRTICQPKPANGG